MDSLIRDGYGVAVKCSAAALFGPISRLATCCLAKCHEHTIRKYFHDGRLKGRQDSKGIFIFASELEEYKK